MQNWNVSNTLGPTDDYLAALPDEVGEPTPLELFGPDAIVWRIRNRQGTSWVTLDLDSEASAAWLTGRPAPGLIGHSQQPSSRRQSSPRSFSSSRCKATLDVMPTRTASSR